MGISVLMIGTLLIALVIGIVLWTRFMAKPQNRHPMEGERERNIEEIRRDAPGDV